MTATSPGDHQNPFPGLRPFRPDEAHLFFGRQNQIDAMVDKLAQTQFLAVIGSSGSGKSSLVNCGLRPALRQGLMARAGTAWRIAQFRPGNDPIAAMACALAQKGVLFDQETEGLTLAEIVEATLRMSKLGVVDICEQAALDEHVNLLVVVDQFEELFRYRQLTGAATSAEDATAFVNLLLEAKAHPESRIFVVLTMRSDFLGNCTQFPGLAEAINAGQYLVPRLTRDERRDAIECPVRVGDAQMSPVLLTRLVNDVGDNPDQLSILQHALNRTWAYWRDKTGGKGLLELEHYEAIGTMDHALDQHANQAFGELDERQRQIAEKLFKTLTDKATDARGVRRPTPFARICEIVGAMPVEVAAVIDVFREPSRSFLMPPAGERLEPQTVVDISHESLMRVWQRLNSWAEQEAASAQTYLGLADAAEKHKAGERSLWRDPELELGIKWRDKSQPNEAWACQYHPRFAAAMQFLTDSSKARDDERDDRQRQRQQQLDAEREKTAIQARNARRMFWAAAISASLALFAIAGGVIALVFFWQANRSERIASLNLYNAQVTQSRSLLAAAQQDKADHVGKILLALEALPSTKVGGDRALVSDALVTLIEGLYNQRELSIIGGHSDAAKTRKVASVAFMPDGETIVTGSTDGTTRVWNAKTGKELLKFAKEGGTVFSIAVTEDGSRIVTGSDDGKARIWDAKTGTKLLTLEGHSRPIRSIALTQDGSQVVTGSEDRTARLWSAVSGATLRQFGGHGSTVRSVAIQPDGNRIVTGSEDGTVHFWDAITSVELGQLNTHIPDVYGMAITRDGNRIVTGSADGVARVWSVANGAELFELKGHTGAINAVIITADGRHIASASKDGTVRIWDMRSRSELFQLKGHTSVIEQLGEPGSTAAVLAVAMTPNGERILTGSDDGTARVWSAAIDSNAIDLKIDVGAASSAVAMSNAGPLVIGLQDGTAGGWDTNGRVLFQLRGHTGAVNSVAVAHVPPRIFTGSEDRTIRVWDGRTGRFLFSLEAGSAVRRLAATPDASLVALALEDGTARLWDGKAGSETRSLKARTSAVRALAVTADGTRLVTGSEDGTVDIWDSATGNSLHHLQPHTGSITSIAIAPDGAHFVTGSEDGTAFVFDTRSGKQVSPLIGHTTTVSMVAVASDGSTIVTVAEDGAVRLWNAKPGPMEPTVVRLKNDEYARVLAVMPDGSGVVTASHDGKVALWNTRSQKDPQVIRRHGVYRVAATSDGSRIVAVSGYGTAGIWDAKTGREVALKGHAGSVSGIAISADGSFVVTGSTDGTVRVWNGDNGEELKSHNVGPGPVRGVTATPDASLVVAIAADRTLRLWRWRSDGETKLDVGKDGLSSIAITSDGTRIVTDGARGTVLVLDAKTGYTIRRLGGSNGAITSVGVTTSDSRIVAGTVNGTALVWDAGTGQELVRLLDYPDWPEIPHKTKDEGKGRVRVVVSPDGSKIATVSDKGVVHLWDATTGTDLLRLSADAAVFSIAAFGSGIVTGSLDGARVWDLSRLPPSSVARSPGSPSQTRWQLIENARASVPRCLTTEQRTSFGLGPEPPDWCIRMQKYPYDAREWQDVKSDPRRDPNTKDEAVNWAALAQKFGNLADKLLKTGDSQSALEASQLGLQFDFKEEEKWIWVNKAHALMFLGEEEEARAAYYKYRIDTKVNGDKTWKEAIIEDFKDLRRAGRCHPLMKELEVKFQVKPTECIPQ